MRIFLSALKHINPNDKNEETQDYQNVIVIHMTDNETIQFTTEDSLYYEGIKNKLRDIVGGKTNENTRFSMSRKGNGQNMFPFFVISADTVPERN